MRRRHTDVTVVLLVAASGIDAVANGCSAGNPPNGDFTTSSASTHGTGGAGGVAGAGMDGGPTTGGGGTGSGFDITVGSGGAGGHGGGAVVDSCSNACGPVELCDEAHLGLDDNCNGLVDEGCACQAGQAHFCFKGNPAKHGAPGCYDGTEICSEMGLWGACIGGVHDYGDNCSANDTTACHPITSPPYASVHLAPGTGNFGANALPGSESYTVECPTGVSQCPMVMAPDGFTPLQSGEYTVTYTKMVAGDPDPKSCSYPLFVGAPGLRVELSWEHTTADDGVDLDLHVHEPNSTLPWGISPAVPQDCTWSNCVVSKLTPPQDVSSPRWFSDPPALPPAPVNWYDDTSNPLNNTCYNDPRGVGAKWKALGLGCHDPRLDADNITCDYHVTDPSNISFCTPENINIDYPPSGQWIRVGVHYYNNHGLGYDVHPEIKIFCNGALAADLGPGGYYDPEKPVTFKPSDGAGIGGNRFWIAADVAFSDDMCSGPVCTVRPIYADPAQKTPFFVIDTTATSTFAPPYPPGP